MSLRQTSAQITDFSQVITVDRKYKTLQRKKVGRKI